MKKGKKSKKDSMFELKNRNAAGVDIGSRFHFVAVPEGRDEKPVRRFGSFTADLRELAGWLKECGIETVAMESTGVYWVQLFLVLESYGLEVLLVNARHIKNVSGRKSDVLDCQWIQQLHSYGLLNGSFQPGETARSLRGYMRHRRNLTGHMSTHILHMQKAFEQMNIKLHNAITDITGKSGQAIIRAILAGGRDPEALADLAERSVKCSRADLVKSLEGNWGDGPLFELRQSHELYLFYRQKIAECDREIERAMAAFNTDIDTSGYGDVPRKVRSKNRLGFNATLYLKDILGVDVTKIFGISEITAAEIVGEVGPDMSKWSGPKHFTSWLNLAPNTRVSGGRELRQKRRPVKNRATQAFKMAAFALQRGDHWLGDFYRRKKAKSGPLSATKATARKLAVIFYNMVRNQQEFMAVPLDEYREGLRDKKLKYLERQAGKLNMALVPI